jgi:hypothetical protein
MFCESYYLPYGGLYEEEDTCCMRRRSNAGTTVVPSVYVSGCWREMCMMYDVCVNCKLCYVVASAKGSRPGKGGMYGLRMYLQRHPILIIL